MLRTTSFSASLFLAPLVLAASGIGAPAAPADGENWPSWRGPDRNGVARSTTAPTTWDEETNVKWRVELPGLGISTPIVWGDKLYVTSAVDTGLTPEGEAPAAEPEPEEGAGRGGRGRGRGRGRRSAPKTVHEFRVMCVDRATGDVEWSKTVVEAVPHETGHSTNAQVAASPITDGEHIWAFFGSRGLHCLDMKGEVVWSKQFGQMQTRNQFGEGASPALHDGTIVMVWDHEGDDFIAAFDAKSGEEKWRKDRDEATTWVTPLIVEVGDRAQVIVSATTNSRAYDLETGDIIWTTTGMTMNCIPMPIHHEGIVYLMSGFRGSALQAIQLEGAKGDLDEDEHVLWRYGKNTPYVPSGVLANGRLYFLRVNSGRVTCLDAVTGEELFAAENLGGIRAVYGSLTAVGDLIYVTSREGETVVFKASETFEEVSSNVLDDQFDASPVVVDGELYLRGRKALYCIVDDAD